MQILLIIILITSILIFGILLFQNMRKERYTLEDEEKRFTLLSNQWNVLCDEDISTCRKTGFDNPLKIRENLLQSLNAKIISDINVLKRALVPKKVSEYNERREKHLRMCQEYKEICESLGITGLPEQVDLTNYDTIVNGITILKKIKDKIYLRYLEIKFNNLQRTLEGLCTGENEMICNKIFGMDNPLYYPAGGSIENYERINRKLERYISQVEDEIRKQS